MGNDSIGFIPKTIQRKESLLCDKYLPKRYCFAAIPSSPLKVFTTNSISEERDLKRIERMKIWFSCIRSVVKSSNVVI